MTKEKVLEDLNINIQHNFKKFDKILKEDIDIIKSYLEKHLIDFSDIPIHLQENKDLIEILLRKSKNFYFVKKIKKEILEDINFIKKFDNIENFFQFLPEKIKDNMEIIEKVIEKKYNIINFCSDKILLNKEIAEILINKIPEAFIYFRKLVRENEKIFKIRFKKSSQKSLIFKYSGNDIKNNENFILENIEKCPNIYFDLNSKNKNNKEIIIKMLKNKFDIYENLNNRNKSDINIIKLSIENGNKKILKEIPYEIRINEEIIEELFKNFKELSLIDTKTNIKYNKQILKIRIKNHKDNIYVIPFEILYNDIFFLKYLIDLYPEVIDNDKIIPQSLKIKYGIAKEKFIKNINTIICSIKNKENEKNKIKNSFQDFSIF